MAALALFLLSDGMAAREVVSFNYNWRHRLGLHTKPGPPPPPLPPPPKCNGTDVWPANATGIRTNGLRPRTDATTAGACSKACCSSSSCQVWQFSNQSEKGGCWIGLAGVNVSDDKWIGGLRSTIVPPDDPPFEPNPGPNPPEAQTSYDDSSWDRVQVPHDGLVGQAPNQALCPNGCSGNSYIPRHVMWYRKTFSIPAEWAGSAVWLDFEGVFREATIYLNGVNVSYHACGYTPFRLRLDNISSVIPAGKGENTLALFVDPDNGEHGGRRKGSGWWYEGGGIYRSVKMVRASLTHVAQDGLFAYANVSAAGIRHAADPADGGSATGAVVHVSVEFQNDEPLGGATEVCGAFQLVDSRDGGKTIATYALPKSVSVPAGGTATVEAQMKLDQVRIWTIQSPYLYTMVFNTTTGCQSGASVIDSVSVPVGFRAIRYDSNQGFFLNEKRFKVRGFCDHNNLGVVGMAVPDRLNLFRAQASRAVGGNGRRTSHNPPNPEMLDIYDRVGVVVMDENRLFANETVFVENMGAMVKRDRNHPSIVIWSFCNEGGCEGTQEDGGQRFYDITYRYDGSRPTLANMFSYGDELSNIIDVQGFSHRSRSVFDECHAKEPDKPIFASECCSCPNMRGEDSANGAVLPAVNAGCLEQQVNESNAVDYVAGSMVWTLFDYYGEPRKPYWPMVSSTFGQFDLAGFPKAPAYWYRAFWLNQIPDSNADKTFSTGDDHFVYIVESWEQPSSPSSNKSIHVYTDVDFSNGGGIQLLVNGQNQGMTEVPKNPSVSSDSSYAEFSVRWVQGNLTAIAIDGKGAVVASATRFTSGDAAAIRISVDCPSPATGTGSALLLDGQDTGLVRAEVVDGQGRVVHNANVNVTFRIVSGPGVVRGAVNGDSFNHDRNDQPWTTAYHGLARAVIQVTESSALPAPELSRIREIDGVKEVGVSSSDDAIVVEVSADGYQSSRVSISVSRDAAKDSVMAIAEASAGKPLQFFG